MSIANFLQYYGTQIALYLYLSMLNTQQKSLVVLWTKIFGK